MHIEDLYVVVGCAEYVFIVTGNTPSNSPLVRERTGLPPLARGDEAKI